MKSNLLLKVILLINIIVIIVAIVAIQTSNYQLEDDPGYVQSKKMTDQQIVIKQFTVDRDMIINMLISNESDIKLFGHQIKTFAPNTKNFTSKVTYPIVANEGETIQIIGDFDIEEVEYSYRHGGKEYHFYRLQVIKWLNRIDHESSNIVRNNIIQGPLSDTRYRIRAYFSPSAAEWVENNTSNT